MQSSVLPDGLVIPKVESAQHLAVVDATLERALGAEKASKILVIALIESVMGMVSISHPPFCLCVCAGADPTIFTITCVQGCADVWGGR